jgi:hypothetical protein
MIANHTLYPGSGILMLLAANAPDCVVAAEAELRDPEDCAFEVPDEAGDETLIFVSFNHITLVAI